MIQNEKVNVYYGTKESYEFEKQYGRIDENALDFVEGVLYCGYELYSQEYKKVSSYPSIGQKNCIYINTTDSSVAIWDDESNEWLYLKEGNDTTYPADVYRIVTGNTNGTIKVYRTNGTNYEVNVKGLGGSAYKDYNDSSSANALSSSGTGLVTQRRVYHGLPYINNSHSYSSTTYIYAPTSAGTLGQILQSNSSGAPSWSNVMQHGRLSGSTIGTKSFTWGYGYNTASGTNSFALGYSNTSTGDGGFAMGRINTAGNDTIDGVKVPVAIGQYNKVTASDAAGIGYGNTVKGNSSMALGASNTIEENSYCVALGSSNTCSKTNSIAIGDRNQALGKWSLSKGYYAIANQGQETCGHFNSSMDASVTSGADTTTAFIIGNGSSDTERSNALRILYDGTVYSNGSYNATGADYAEYFEWEDGNPNNEDRRGYFVTFAEGDLIRKATDNDDYILGIVSGNPCIIGNADEHWCGQYLLDEFGAYIMEEKEVEYEDIEFAEDEEGNIIENAVKKKRTSISYKENPDYDASQQYIPRSERQEWDAIGMMGVLSVRDDGTCKVNGYCKCNNNGIATYCEKDIDTYRVIKRVSENVIKIVVFK